MDSDFEPFIFAPEESPRYQDNCSKSMDVENLKYLSKFQNPHLNKLLSALASDTPLQNPIRVKSRLMHDIDEMAAIYHPPHDLSKSTCATAMSKTPVCKSNSSDPNYYQKSYKRSIRCATAEIDHDQPPHSVGTLAEPSPPLSAVFELFSPSLFEIDTPEAKRRRVFTFESTHIDGTSKINDASFALQPLSPSIPKSGTIKSITPPHHRESLSPDSNNQPPPITTTESPYCARRIGRLSDSQSAAMRTIDEGTSTLHAQTLCLPVHRAMDESDFAELYDVANEAGFFADTPKHADRSSPHPPFLEFNTHAHMIGEYTPTTRRSKSPDLLVEQSHRFSDTHQFNDSISSSPASGKAKDCQVYEPHIAIPSISELDKVLTGYSHSQRTCVIPSPPKGVAKKKRLIVRNPLDEMGVEKVVDSSGVIVQQRTLKSFSNSYQASEGGGCDDSPMIPTVLPSIPAFLRMPTQATLSVTIPPRDVFCGIQAPSSPHSFSSSYLHSSMDGRDEGVGEEVAGNKEPSHMSLSSLCVLLINDCQKKEHIRDAKRYVNVFNAVP